MIEKITLHAFDEMVNPIFITEPDGIILYKNPEAARKIKRPQKGGSIQKYLSIDHRPLLGASFAKECFPALVDIETPEEAFTAFVDVVYYERRPVLLFVLSHLFLYDLSIPFFIMPPATRRTLISGERIANLATEVYTSEQMPEVAKNRAHHRRMTDIFYHLTDRLLTELAYGIAKVHFPLDYTFDILRYACDKVLSHLGLDILFEIKSEDVNIWMADFKTLTILTSGLILFAAEVSDSHIIRATVDISDNGELLLTFSMRTNKQHNSIPTGGTGSFSEILPGRALDLFFFDKICYNSQYRLGLTMNQKEENNLRLKLQAPLFRPTFVRSRDLFRLQDAIQLIDAFLAECSLDDNR